MPLSHDQFVDVRTWGKINAWRSFFQMDWSDCKNSFEIIKQKSYYYIIEMVLVQHMVQKSVKIYLCKKLLKPLEKKKIKN